MDSILQFLAKTAATWAYEQASAFMEIFARFPNPLPALSVPPNGGASPALWLSLPSLNRPSAA